jgi:hypothetical protein
MARMLNQAGALAPPLRRTISADDAHDVAPPTDQSGTSERPATRIASRDPRSRTTLSARDMRALLFIAMMGTCALYQLGLGVFPLVTEVVVSRCVRRLVRIGLIDTLRWNKIGLNLLKLRAAGRKLILDTGVEEGKIFMARWPTASSLAHRLWIIDSYLALQQLDVKVQVCWMLRRKFAGLQQPIPDVLARRSDGALLAIEIDRASESVRDVVAPRQSTFSESLAAIARAASLRKHLPATTGRLVVDLLPELTGRPTVAALASLFSRTVQWKAQLPSTVREP